MSHLALQDAVKFQGYEYEIEGGVLFPERNYKIQEVITHMFEQRLKYKAEKNPVEKTYKLILNSSYGKTIQKFIETQIKIVSNENLPGYLEKNYEFQTSLSRYGNTWFVKEMKQLED